MTSLELFAFVILPVGIAASAWAVVLTVERRGAAKAGPRSDKARAADAPKRP